MVCNMMRFDLRQRQRLLDLLDEKAVLSAFVCPKSGRKMLFGLNLVLTVEEKLAWTRLSHHVFQHSLDLFFGRRARRHFIVRA